MKFTIPKGEKSVEIPYPVVVLETIAKDGTLEYRNILTVSQLDGCLLAPNPVPLDIDIICRKKTVLDKIKSLF